MKCGKISNARAEPLFCSLNLLFGDVLVAVVVVVCLSSLMWRRGGRASGPGSSPSRGRLKQYTLLSQCLSPPRPGYKWVPGNFARGNPAMDWHSIEVETIVASCY